MRFTTEEREEGFEGRAGGSAEVAVADVGAAVEVWGLADGAEDVPERASSNKMSARCLAVMLELNGGLTGTPTRSSICSLPRLWRRHSRHLTKSRSPGYNTCTKKF